MESYAKQLHEIFLALNDERNYMEYLAWEKCAHFSFKILSYYSIMLKIDHIILLWLNAIPEAKKVRLEELVEKVKRSLESLSSRADKAVETSAQVEQASPPGNGYIAVRSLP